MSVLNPPDSAGKPTVIPATDPIPKQTRSSNSSQTGKYGNLKQYKSAPRRIASSTSSPLTDGDVGLNKPNCLVHSVCTVLQRHIEDGAKDPNAQLPNCFSEIVKPLNIPGDSRPREFRMPSTEEIGAFVMMIVRQLELSSCVCLMALYYIDQMLKKGVVTIHPTNWRRICLSCLLLAGKVFHDEAPWNADVSDSFDWIELNDVNHAESQLLKFLDFSVTFTPREYANYYYNLREIAQREFNILPIEILTQEQLDQLESKTKIHGERVIKSHHEYKSLNTHDHAKVKPGIIS